MLTPPLRALAASMALVAEAARVSPLPAPRLAAKVLLIATPIPSADPDQAAPPPPWCSGGRAGAATGVGGSDCAGVSGVSDGRSRGGRIAHPDSPSENESGGHLPAACGHRHRSLAPTTPDLSSPHWPSWGHPRLALPRLATNAFWGAGVCSILKERPRRRGSAGGLGRGLARDRVDPRLERSLTQRDARVEWRKEP